MLLHDAGLSFLHFSFAFILAGALSGELFVLRLPINAQAARLLLRIDLFYGVSAVGLIAAGIARILWGAKGWEFYANQPFFWAKMAVFVLIGVLSILPTLTYLRWVKTADATFMAAAPEVKRMRLLVTIEVHLLVLVIAFAALMARGIGI